ncbi:MAG: RdgB/HAM1 family non-canonical purine NTP pyrophosphatase [Bacteroidetes bacterium OLB12]|nr:MAG: RdgB/HAM1 family non-canonical purine NTP pyrophosphatase [Bacteroidetes bacterium OLB12]HNQ13598.1 non-canonical purine NTP diphosphatase [Bacteroidia bacterium]
MTLCFATNNTHKIKEIQALLGNSHQLLSLRDIGCTEELAEDQETLEGNSLQKAEYVFQHYKVACFADDTGLEVEALNGAPGVYSARYAGDQRQPADNMQLLLKNLQGEKNLKARFRTVITLITKKGTHQFEGILNGTITFEQRGTQGFGYDPVFVPEGYAQTLAELSLDEKNKISHRARAVQKLVLFLKAAR